MAGNMDSPECQQKLAIKILEVAGFRLDLPMANWLISTTPQRALAIFAQDNVDAVVFGIATGPIKKRKRSLLLTPAHLRIAAVNRAIAAACSHWAK